MDPQDSFTDVMTRLRAGDDRAAAAVFDRVARRPAGLARARLDQRVRTQADPEDIVQSVYRSFFTRYGAGQFDLASWDGLWGMLVRIAERKCINKRLHAQAQRRDVRREVPLDGPA